MKKYIGFFLIIFLSFASYASASNNATVYCPDDDEPVTLRSSAGGTPIGSMACNSQLEVLDVNGGTTNNCKTWYKVRQGILTGYACGNYIKLDSASTTEEGKVLCIEDTSPLGVYSDINRTNKLTGLSCDTKVEILDKNAGADGKGTCPTSLYKIKYGSITGYVCGKYIGDVGSSSPSNPNVGKSTTGDNIYVKDNYQNKPSGDGTISCFEDTGNLPLKKTVGGSSSGSVSCGEEVTINSTVESSGICPYYYNITDSRRNSGYVCSYYVNTTKLSSTASQYYEKHESLDNYYNKLRNEGFPDSYLPYLAELHARHPNWEFNAERINIDFDEVINGENAYGRNLLEGSAFNENYYSMGINSYDILNNRFSYYPTESGWYDASSEAVAFYLDPRNYLNIKYILAFELLNYNNAHTADAVSKILTKNDFWNAVYSGQSSNISADIVNATREIGISSLHIASRIEQEIAGISTSDPRAGGTFTYNGNNYSGYYNFFNINVWGENKIIRGMKYAMDNGWNTPYKGIYGGSGFIYNEYVAINQDTLYYEKFDVSTSDGNYTHQYMQNLAAVAQETNKVYKTYVNNIGDYFNKDLTFTIPVYNNMSNYAVTSPRLGNPNNYLNDLKVNGTTVSGFSYDTYNYDITVPYDTSNINVSASKISANAIVNGTGDISINSDEKKVLITVTAENNNTRTYTINVKRLEKGDEKDRISIDTILNNSGIRYNGNYIFGINENTSISSLINNVAKVSTYASAEIKDKNGNRKASGIFKTGDVVTISNGLEDRNMNVVIYGDINGDGKIDKDDCLAILRHLNGYTKLSASYLVAADPNHDNKIDKDDCLAILRHLNGYTNLNK